MSRRRNDSQQELQKTRVLSRENQRLKKQIRQLNSMVPGPSFDEESPEDPKQKAAPKPVSGVSCHACGASTEILDLEIFKYYQCTKDKTHRKKMPA
jgi:hypothetical protein